MGFFEQVSAVLYFFKKAEKLQILNVVCTFFLCLIGTIGTDTAPWDFEFPEVKGKYSAISFNVHFIYFQTGKVGPLFM